MAALVHVYHPRLSGHEINNGGAGGASCAETPSLFPPDSCKDGVGNFTLGGNLIPGPALF